MQVFNNAIRYKDSEREKNVLSQTISIILVVDTSSLV